MGDTNQILAANQRFYDAFSSGDFIAMQEIWADSDTISCIHPGWPSLNTRKDVLSSWHSILSTQSVFISVSDEDVHLFGDTAYVICREHLQPGTLLATNIFCRTGPRWQLVHHQAGLMSSQSQDAFLVDHPTIQ